MKLYPRSLILAGILTLLVVVLYQRWNRESGEYRTDLRWLCEAERHWFEKLAARCHSHADSGVPWNAPGEENETLKTQFWVGDPPRNRTGLRRPLTSIVASSDLSNGTLLGGSTNDRQRLDDTAATVERVHGLVDRPLATGGAFHGSSGQECLG